MSEDDGEQCLEGCGKERAVWSQVRDRPKWPHKRRSVKTLTATPSVPCASHRRRPRLGIAQTQAAFGLMQSSLPVRVARLRQKR